MRRMTDGAVSGSHRAVHLFAGGQPIVADQAQPPPGLQQQSGIGALMRIVAIGATISHGRMDERQPLGRIVMTVQAQIAPTGDKFKANFPGMRRRDLVAGGTLTGSDRRMHHLAPTEGRVTVSGHTRRESTGCGQHECARNQKKENCIVPVRQDRDPLCHCNINPKGD